MITLLPKELEGPTRAVEAEELQQLTNNGWTLVAMVEATVSKSFQEPNPAKANQPNYYGPETISVQHPVSTVLFVLRQDPESRLSQLAAENSKLQGCESSAFQSRAEVERLQTSIKMMLEQRDANNKAHEDDMRDLRSRLRKAEEAPRAMEAMLAKVRKALGELAWKELEKS